MKDQISNFGGGYKPWLKPAIKFDIDGGVETWLKSAIKVDIEFDIDFNMEFYIEFDFGGGLSHHTGQILAYLNH